MNRQKSGRQCENCRNYEFIMNQLQVIKKQIMHKNQRIIELEMFIEHISKMALTDSTQSHSDHDQNNPMELTFKNNCSVSYDSASISQKTISKPSVRSSKRSERLSDSYSSGLNNYATESDLHEEGVAEHMQSISVSQMLSKRTNESTNYF